MANFQWFDPNSFKAVRVVATDMDGTLTQGGKFSPVLLQRLQQLASSGVSVIIVTGRSAGWVQGVISYLPIAGAIAENGGIFFNHSDRPFELLVPLADVVQHRRILAELFRQLQQEFPAICESVDNPFRITDWTFDVHGLSVDDLTKLRDRCANAGFGFTYSTVQCHILPQQQNKADALKVVLQRYFADIGPNELVTVGDSPNDESLFQRARFPLSVGVANVRHYLDQLTHCPRFITPAAEVEGFSQLAEAIVLPEEAD